MTQPEWPVMDQGQPREPNSAAPAPPSGEPDPGLVPDPAQPAAPGGIPTGSSCPSCGQPVDPAAWYCEACGGPLLPTAAPPAPAAPSGDASAQTRRLGSRASQVIACPACGGTVGADGYCQTCGAKAPSLRDHFAVAPAPWVGGVCDRGILHHRNEDAMALWAGGARAVLVVCDGVSTSIDSDVAAMAAAGRACDVLTARSSSAVAGDQGEDAAMAQALVEAVAEANRAVIATTAADSTNAASATFAAAVVVGDRVHFANLGDSRVYFLGGTAHRLLSVDDSMAQAFIAEGMPREEAEALPRAHAITKWLGRDSVDTIPRTGVLQVTEPGWLLVCTDGLWNYASTPEELAAQLPADTDPLAVAQHLVTWANGQGGHDNVTVALARVPAPVVPGSPGTLGAAPTEEEKEQPQHG